jgi:hypothetical protein
MYRMIRNFSRWCALGTAVALVAMMSPPNASAELYLQRGEFTGLLLAECTGEDIAITGVWQSVTATHTNAQDGVSYARNNNLVHGTAVGLASGRRYVYVETAITHYEYDPVAMLYTDQLLIRVKLVAQGSYPDLIVLTRVQVIQTPTEEIVNVTMESACRAPGGSSH